MRYSRHNPTRGPEHYTKMGQKLVRDVLGYLDAGDYRSALIVFANAHSDGLLAIRASEDVGALGHHINEAMNLIIDRIA